MATLRGGQYGRVVTPRTERRRRRRLKTGMSRGELMEFREACERWLAAHRLPRVTDEERRMRRLAGEL